MCTSCGCQETGSIPVTETVSVRAGLLEENDHVARHNREHFLSHGVLVVNLMSSPGAGKTSLLEQTIDALGARYGIGVIEGDLATENDAERIRSRGVPAVQITTGNACHLDATMIHAALHELDLDAIDILFVENVGNLVCPAAFDLGQDFNVVLLSTPEGDDKPGKYPVMFRAADLILISKSDLLPYLTDFSTNRAAAYLKDIGVDVPVKVVSIESHSALAGWLEWLEDAVRERAPAVGASVRSAAG